VCVFCVCLCKSAPAAVAWHDQIVNSPTHCTLLRIFRVVSLVVFVVALPLQPSARRKPKLPGHALPSCVEVVGSIFTCIRCRYGGGVYPRRRRGCCAVLRWRCGVGKAGTYLQVPPRVAAGEPFTRALAICGCSGALPRARTLVGITPPFASTWVRVQGRRWRRGGGRVRSRVWRRVCSRVRRRGCGGEFLDNSKRQIPR
jgi:hypothetical protein